uniref:Uncharacterized protein n=4 Tax=Nostocales TaxID=1161 RepID=A0A0C1R1A4_9CYAN
MKNNSIRIRLSDRRLNKLRLYAAQSDKTMTQVVEELIDSLPQPKEIGEQRGLGGFRQEATAHPKGNSSSTPLPR